jgi:hypothetical protein
MQDCQDMTAERFWALEPGFWCYALFFSLVFIRAFAFFICFLLVTAKKRWLPPLNTGSNILNKLANTVAGCK